VEGESGMKLFEFAYCGFFNKKIDILAQLCPENWGSPKMIKDKAITNPVLQNYIMHTFSKLYDDYENAETPDEKKKFINIKDGAYCVFNTGLFDRKLQRVYAYLIPNKRAESGLNWYLDSFVTEYQLAVLGVDFYPLKANYFIDSSDFVFNLNYTIIPQYDHIFGDENNRQRIPESIRDSSFCVEQFEEAILTARKRIDANYKVAVPQYFEGKIQLLIPIYLLHGSEPDLALVVTKDEAHKRYLGHTFLTIEMAYNNARLIAKPDSEWLKP
jgi:hypothetical protein